MRVNKGPFMQSIESKKELIQIRVTRREKLALESAARRRGQTVSDFLRQGAAALIDQVAAR
jgi:uncharacterized protein (DUF1778 family)